MRVFNAGIVGYTILDELAYLREKGIISSRNSWSFGVFENDLSDLRREKNGIVQRPHDGIKARTLIWLKALARSSALFNVAERIKSRMHSRLRASISVAASLMQRGGALTNPARSKRRARQTLQ